MHDPRPAPRNTAPALDAALARRIVEQVREDEIVTACCEVVNISSPTGHELEMAKYMRAAFESLGLAVTWQEVEEGRANVIGRWEGVGTGPNLMFNGHMDTSDTGDEPFLTGIGYKPRAVVREGAIFGLGIYNMKGALVCYLHAVKALQRAGVRLSGDVILGAVAGEIEKAQWGEFVGKQYRGYGVGTHHVVNHGVLPDMCILGEPTDMKLVLEHYGSLWVRLSTHGNYVHTAFARDHENENAIRRMHQVLAEVMRWSEEWNREACCGDARGVVNVGCVQGGHPWRVSRTPERCDLFLDVRVPPQIEMTEARRQVKSLYSELKNKFPSFELEFETYVSVPGAQIDPGHEMVQSIIASHSDVVGAPPERDTVLWCSDASVLSRYGVPTVNYGPSSGPRDAEGEKVRVETLVAITKVYALTAARICSVAN